MFRLRTAFLVLVAVSIFSAPALAQTTTCIPAAEFEGQQCDDGNTCTSGDTCRDGECVGGSELFCGQSACNTGGLCVGDTCVGLPRREGQSCDDNDPCTIDDTCQGGQCVGAACDDDDPCTTDSCASGACTHEPIPGCVACVNGACDDGNQCTTDTCNDGVCSFQNRVGSCDDGDACTQTDTCQSGACIGANPVVCAAPDQCHTPGTCDPGTGVCSNPAKPDDARCDDGNECTQADTCQDGACVGADPVVCATPDQCHLPGTCDPQTGVCSNPTRPNGADCSDGNACTQTDTCQGGVCGGANPVVCATPDQCHDAGTCNPSTGICSNPAKPNSTPCNDGSACTQTDTCQAGTCSGGSPVVCTASDQCHDIGTCNPSTGVCSNPPKANGQSCSDGNACTQADTCQAGSCTGGNPKTCTASDQCHDAGTCNPSTGVCSNPPKSDDTGCTDGNGCTQTDTCQGGTCVGGAPKTCTASDQCHDAGTCNPSTGVCSNPSKPNSTPCNDGSLCTKVDSCQAGVCTGSDPVVCTPFSQCHVPGVCRPENGTCTNPSAPNNTPCDDGDGCTENDRCQAAVCNSGPARSCDDADACTTDTCEAGACQNRTQSGCIACGEGLPSCDDGNPCTDETCVAGKCEFINVDARTCDDGNACTQTDTCQAGTCTGANPVVCTASDQCHEAGTCNTTTGVCSNPPKPNGQPCADGNACTQTDTCQAGACTGANPVICATPDQCHDAGTCNPSTGVCSNPAKPNDTPCSDGNACTQTDTCQGGACTGANPKTCTASDQCHDAGTCNPSTGVCSNPSKPNDTPCGDGNACTQTDTCQTGVCTGGNPKTCTAFSQCHVPGVCNPTTGNCTNPSAPNNTPCDDGDGCSVNDVCQSAVCTAGPPRNCNDQDECTTDTCEEGSCENRAQSGCRPCGPQLPCNDANTCTDDTCVAGKCQFANVNVRACDDANPCTTASICQNGDCVGTTPVVCQPNDQCLQAGTCIPSTGLCSDGPPRPNGTPCTDGDLCTLSDTCQGGSCAAGAERNCADDVACTDDRCAAGLCFNDPIDSRCAPGDCLTGRCDPTATGADAAGCVADAAPDGVGCSDDGIACTEDVCTPTGCAHLPIDDRCTPENECASATCAPTAANADAAGCVTIPGPAEGAECVEDDDPCTNDVCTAGDCAHTPAGEAASCRPVEGPYRRARSLLEFTRGLQALVASVVTPGETGGTNRGLLLERLDGVEADLDRIVTILSGRAGATPTVAPLLTPRGSKPDPVLLEGTIAQQRGRIAFTQVKSTPAKVKAFLSLLALAKRRAEVSATTARDLRSRGRSLLTGTKALKRDLKRLQRVNQVFAR